MRNSAWKIGQVTGEINKLETLIANAIRNSVWKQLNHYQLPLIQFNNEMIILYKNAICSFSIYTIDEKLLAFENSANFDFC